MTKPLSRKQLEVEDRKHWIDATIQSIKEARYFSMAEWDSCIGYHCHKVSGNRMLLSVDNILHTVAERFHISTLNAYDLCASTAAQCANRKDAIRTLEHLRDTGEVIW
jgi:hypothetical protein